jgi:Ca2+-binding EF-hand superfamily protein
MVSSVSGSTGGLSNWADSVFSKLDTKNQGYIDKTDLASALSATGESEGSGDTSAVDDMFGALDGDSDGKVTRSELTDAMTKLADQLNAQFDASRVNGGTDGTSSTSADYVAAADTDGDGTVSEAEQAAYDKKVASGQAGDGSDTASAEGAGKPQQQRDPMRELAHALNLLKAYAANSGDSDSSATTADTGSSVSVEA